MAEILDRKIIKALSVDTRREIVKMLSRRPYTASELASGSVNIALQFQPALVNLTIANLLPMMNLTGTDGTSFTLGDLSQGGGGRSNLIESSEFFKEQGMKELNAIGKDMRYQKAFV